VTPEAQTAAAPRGLFSPPVLTVPNLITVIRLACIPVFVWLLFGRDDRAWAAWLLGALGATDWVDGWVARRFRQVSELGKVLDPTVDRLLFIVGAAGIIIDGAVPLWFCWAIVVREVLVGGAMVVFTALGMQRFPVTWWGKTGTFLLMFALPGLLLGASDFVYADVVTVASWILGVPGLFISWYAAFMYVPTMRASLHEGRQARKKVP
jgi:cardiolipin synthase (CMP-forming)